MSKVKKVAVITRMSTENAGNEALSIALIRYLKAKMSEAEIRGIDRHPSYFSNFTIKRYAGAPEAAIAKFEADADRLITDFKPAADGPLRAAASENQVQLRQQPKLRSKFTSELRRRLALRGRLAKLGLIDRDRVSTLLNTIEWSDLVVWNPAGEFHPSGNSDEGVRLLLIARVAQKLGKKLAVVNHSLESTDPVLKTLISHVYKEAEFVSVREQGSYDEGIRLGTPADRLVIAPDLVFTLDHMPQNVSTSSSSIPDDAIILSINGLEAYKGHDEWDALFASLGKLGKPLAFVSNSMNDDIPFARKFEEKYNIAVLSTQPTYSELMAIFSRASVLISSRLHASVLALSQSVPVISIEPQLFKLTAIFEQMNYPIATDRLAVEGWSDRVAKATERAIAEREEMGAYGLEAISMQNDRANAAYRPLIEMAN